MNYRQTSNTDDLLHFVGERDGPSLKLFRQIVNEFDLPFESLNLPGPQRKRHNGYETQGK
jgi:hypothetical protein